MSGELGPGSLLLPARLNDAVVQSGVPGKRKKIRDETETERLRDTPSPTPSLKLRCSKKATACKAG